MSLSVQERDRIDLLVTKLTEGALTRSESRELGALVRERPEVCRYYLDTMLLSVQMRDYVQGTALDVAEPAGPESVAFGSRRIRPRQHSLVRPPAPSGWGWWITGVAAAVLIGLGILLNQRLVQVRLGVGPGQLCVVSVQGAAVLLRNGARMPVALHDALWTGDTVSTEDGAGLAVAYADGTRLELGSGSVLCFERTQAAAAKHVSVLQGMLAARVSRQPQEYPMRVDTTHAELTIAGTQLTVFTGAEQTRVGVTEGTVRLLNRFSRERAVLTAGSFCVVDRLTRHAAGRVRRGRGRRAAGRRDKGLVALYTFLHTDGAQVSDVSGAGAPLHLWIEARDAVEWLPGGGLRVVSPTLIRSRRPAEKIGRACMASNELTIEAWLRTWDPSQGGPARIVCLGPGYPTPDAMLGAQAVGTSVLGEGGTCFNARLKTTDPDTDKMPEVLSVPGSVTTRLTHVVFTRDAAGRVRLVVDGVDRLWCFANHDAATTLRVRTDTRVKAGGFSNWRANSLFYLANELDRGFRSWVGEYYLVAVYSRALSIDEIKANFEAGLHARASERAAVDD